ncbi:MAG: FGGY-family carbohydrate kinase [Rubrobacteraceae bacterium]
MAAEPLLLGADVGTTNIKVVAFDRSGRPLAYARTPTPTHYPGPGRAHYDAEELWRAFAETTRKVTDQMDDPGRIASIAITSMGEAAVPLDADGRPTHYMISWFDGRAQPQAERLAHAIGRDRLFETTGLSLQPIFGLCKLLWLKENEPDAYSRTASWLNVADYVAFRLSGVAATDFSLASRTLALDLHELRWADDLLREIDVSPDLLAPLRPSGTSLGPITPEASEPTGLPESVRVAVGGHDHVCGALATGVTGPGTMLNSLGTAEAIFLPLERPLDDPEVGHQGYTQGAHVAGQYYVFGGQYTSGASIEWFREALGEGADYSPLIAEAEEAPPGSLGVFFLPHLRLANPPYDDPRSRGAFVGLTTDVGRGALFRAVLEGLAYDSRNSLEGLLAHSGVEGPRKIYAIGGVAQNRLLMSIKATVLDREISIVGVEEATSLGAAILGGVGAGVYEDVPSALKELRYEETPVKPVREQVSLYDACFRQVYRRIYPSLREAHHEIHRLHNEE